MNQRLPRVVIAHDFMETYGGAERVTQEMARAFPDAPVIAILGRDDVARRMGVEDRFTSLLRPRRRLLRHYRLLAPVFPAVARGARLPEADVLLSSSYAFSHWMRTRNDAPQVCYCHSPLRFAWSMTDHYRDHGGEHLGWRVAFDVLAAGMRRADRRAAGRVARYLTQSPYTAEQIERYYGQPAEVIGAPVDTDVFRPPETPDLADYFLLCGRLIEPYKRVGVAIEAFRRLGRQLVVAGDGPAYTALRRAAPPNVMFLGQLSDEDLVPLMQHCLAAIFPSRDDFGLTPIEVMACGRPVLAYGGGGALHTVAQGLSGDFFDEQTPEALVGAVERFRAEDYDPQRIRAHAMQWGHERFRERLREAVGAVASGDGVLQRSGAVRRG